MMERCAGTSACLGIHDAAAAGIEDDEVLHEDRRPLGFAGYALPRTYDAALEVLGDRDAIQHVSTLQHCAIEHSSPRLLCEGDGNVAGGHSSSCGGQKEGTCSMRGAPDRLYVARVETTYGRWTVNKGR